MGQKDKYEQIFIVMTAGHTQEVEMHTQEVETHTQEVEMHMEEVEMQT